MTESEVRKLLRQMKEWDSQTAFRRFYDLTYDRLFRIAYYYVKREEWSQEIVLDIFLKLWEQRNTLPEVRNIEDYCFVITKNASLNYLEKEMRRSAYTDNELPESPESDYNPEDELISEELFARYVKALDRLPERCREEVNRERQCLAPYAGRDIHIRQYHERPAQNRGVERAMTESEVRKLLRQMKEWDSQTAFRRFYDLTYDRLFRIAYYYVKREEWSQEIVLDIFLKLWEQRNTLPEVRNIEDYCFVITKNASLNYLEKEMRRSAYTDNELPESPESDYNPEDELISEELFARYVKALDRLPERCREVFIRIREEKQSYAQVAEELGISTKTVDAQLQKATGRLKEMIMSVEID